jgi:hypothetical protein
MIPSSTSSFIGGRSRRRIDANFALQFSHMGLQLHYVVRKVHQQRLLDLIVASPAADIDPIVCVDDVSVYSPSNGEAVLALGVAHVVSQQVLANLCAEDIHAVDLEVDWDRREGNLEVEFIIEDAVDARDRVEEAECNGEIGEAVPFAIGPVVDELQRRVV